MRALIASFELPVDLADALSVRFGSGAIGTLATVGGVRENQEEMLEYRIYGAEGHVLDVHGHRVRPRRQRRGAPPAAAARAPLSPGGTLGQPGGRRARDARRTARRPSVGVAMVELVDALYRSARERRASPRAARRSPERRGFVWRVKPGKAEEYAARHVDIWPALREIMVAHGASEFSIYLWGEIIFATARVRRLRRARRARSSTIPVSLAWEEQFADLLEYPNADPESGWPERLREVWSL